MRGREEDNKREREKKRIGKEKREGGREAANGSFCDTTGRREGEGE